MGHWAQWKDSATGEYFSDQPTDPARPLPTGARWVLAEGRVIPWESGRVGMDWANLNPVEDVVNGEGEPIRWARWLDPASDTWGGFAIGRDVPKNAVSVSRRDDTDDTADIVVREPFVIHLKDGSRIYSRGA
jgi:hypothetical protein